MIGIIGAGKIGKGLIDCLGEVLVSSGHESEYNGIPIVTNNPEIASKSEIIILAVKPQEMPNVLEEIKDKTQGKLVISFAAGLPIDYFESKLGARVIRVMTTIALQKQTGTGGYFLGTNCTDNDKLIIQDILNKAGKYIEVRTEDHLEVIAGISGSGIAYMTKLFDVFRNAGIKRGIETDDSMILIKNTIKGSLALLENRTPEEIITLVASKKGATEQGLIEMEEQGIEEAIEKVIDRTIDKCKALGEIR